MPKFEHINGFVVDVPEHLAQQYEDSPSWKLYVENKPDTILTNEQIVQVAKKKGRNVNQSAEKLLEQVVVKDRTKKRSFNDDII